MFRTDVYVTAEGGEVVAVLEGLTCVPANADSLAGALATLDQKEEESTDVGTGQVAVIRSSQDLAPLLQETAASLLPGERNHFQTKCHSFLWVSHPCWPWSYEVACRSSWA